MTKLEDKGFTINPDIRTYKILRDEMRTVYRELSRLRDCSEMDETLAAKVDLLAELFIGVASESPESPLNQEVDMIDAMERR